MNIYLIVIFISFFLELQNSKNLYLKKLIYFLFGIFLCTTYFNGSDWRQYELMYTNVKINNVFTISREIGFSLYMLLFKELKIDFFHFLIFTKLMVYYIFYKTLERYMQKDSNSYFVLSFFSITMGLYLFIDCPLRNLIAIGLSLIAIRYLEEKKIKKFIVLLFLAASFHKTAYVLVILLPIVFYLDYIFEIKKKNMIFIVMLIWVLFTFQSVLLLILEKLPLFSSRVAVYLGTEYSITSIFSLGNLEKFFFVLLIIFLKDKIFKTRIDKLIYVYLLIYFIFYRVAKTFPVLYRFSLYFQIFYIIGISKVLNNFERKIRICFFLALFIYQGLIIHKTINESYVYYPYISYFEYVFKEKPDYEYRSNFHILEFKKRIKGD